MCCGTRTTSRQMDSVIDEQSLLHLCEMHTISLCRATGILCPISGIPSSFLHHGIRVTREWGNGAQRRRENKGCTTSWAFWGETVAGAKENVKRVMFYC
ncbi:hypothetical protein MLD38_018076 [Melastoma candidum]|uniref:Uncharacterized protein n=1 Tax=Melastoma candidum TaxID=119954 RepID=A0ACB9QSQ5_9MYRT|nr:hypothetical protein MLD38_018076 [Melastoma candidum]